MALCVKSNTQSGSYQTLLLEMSKSSELSHGLAQYKIRYSSSNGMPLVSESLSSERLHGDDLRDDEESDTEATEGARGLTRLEANEQSIVPALLPQHLCPMYDYDDFRSDLRKVQEQIGIPESVNGFAGFLFRGWPQ